MMVIGTDDDNEYTVSAGKYHNFYYYHKTGITVRSKHNRKSMFMERERDIEIKD